jgi:hypothetical protein
VNMVDERIRCFVIMPFSGTTAEHTEAYWTAHYENFLKPAIEENPVLEARRSQALRGDILKEIISTLVVSPIVVADLTDANPNVYWELGVRQSFKHGTITIAEDGTRLPFDIGVKGTLFYHPKNHLRMPEFRRIFAAALADCLSHPDRTDSHVLETISGRGTIYELIRRDEAIRRVDALLDECRTILIFHREAMEIARMNLEPDDPRISSSNESNPRGFITPFSTAALDLLSTTRYLDQDRDFYRRVIACSALCTTVNGQIALWEHHPNNVAQFFASSEKLIQETIENLQTELNEIQKQLHARA